MRAENGSEILFQVTGKITYVFDQVLEPDNAGIFKLKTASPAGDVSVKFEDGSTDIIDCDRLDAMNAKVVVVYDTGTDIAITDFGLYR